MTKQYAYFWTVSLDNGATMKGKASSKELAIKAQNAYISKIEKANKRWPKDAPGNDTLRQQFREQANAIGTTGNLKPRLNKLKSLARLP